MFPDRYKYLAPRRTFGDFDNDLEDLHRDLDKRAPMAVIKAGAGERRHPKAQENLEHLGALAEHCENLFRQLHAAMEECVIDASNDSLEARLATDVPQDLARTIRYQIDAIRRKAFALFPEIDFLY